MADGTYTSYFPTNDRGYLPADTDLDQLLRSGDEQALFAAWNTFHHIRHTRDIIAKLETNPAKAEVVTWWRVELTELAPITPAQALTANRRLVDLLTARRWFTMQCAREAGDSWTVIGDALDMSKQGALDWYKRKIAEQEKYVPDFHDTDRARAALDDAQ